MTSSLVGHHGIVLKRWVLRRRDFETSGAYRREFASLLAHTTIREEHAAAMQELVFGELVTNAVRYGDEPMGVCVDFDDATMTIVVENAGACAESDIRTPGPNAEGGRGLIIVRSIVSGLTIEHTSETACRITATMPVDGEPAP